MGAIQQVLSSYLSVPPLPAGATAAVAVVVLEAMPFQALLEVTVRTASSLSSPTKLLRAMYHVSEHLLELKIAFVATIGFFAVITEAVTELQGWEEASLKVLLVAAVIYLVRSQAQDRKEHKAELHEAWDLHKKESDEREAKTTDAMIANTRALADLTKITEEQTNYFKTVTRTIVDERLKTKATLP